MSAKRNRMNVLSDSKKRFVGFGFGPIQNGLFVYEAYRSGNFHPGGFTIAEVDPALVKAVRDNGGRYTINIAHADRIEPITVEGVTLLNPTAPSDREALARAIAEADVLCTALPSVDFFARGGDASVLELLAKGIQQRDTLIPAIIYTAENNNHAAEILGAELHKKISPRRTAAIQILNTVIGKMSGVITDGAEIARLKLTTLTPATPRAVLVEAFNRILITRITLPGVTSGIPTFVEKDDLLPFEEAKLYGHNAIHALLGYLAHRRGLQTMDQLAQHPDLLAIGREAFISECGQALCRKYATLGDPLFSRQGFRAYAEDLLVRMVNPNLNDLVARVIRDPRRKLGYHDRLYGTMHLALTREITPTNMARGAAAAVRFLSESEKLPITSEAELGRLLESVWGDQRDALAAKLVELTWSALNARD